MALDAVAWKWEVPSYSVADPAKGLRSLATWDADGDGRITAADPVYYQLKVWQDFNQDGNNTHGLTVADATGGHTVIVQDETSFSGSSVKELRTLAELGITAIDYANNRYEFADATQPNGVGYRQIATVTLQAEQEGVRYTPVGVGIKIDTTDGVPQIVITQVQSEEAVFAGLPLATANETIGTPSAPLYEDGVPYVYNPNVSGAITLTPGYSFRIFKKNSNKRPFHETQGIKKLRRCRVYVSKRQFIPSLGMKLHSAILPKYNSAWANDFVWGVSA